MRSVLVEIVAPMMIAEAPSSFGTNLVMGSLGLLKKGREACCSEYPVEWKEALDTLSAWIGNITRLYRHRVRIRLIDAQSPLGFWKQLRHRVFRFPAFILDGKSTYVGWNPEELEALIDERLGNH
jgi:hypothetical protein